MSESPVIHADIGDGKRRRFFLGADELRMIQREAGRGYYSLYTKFAVDAEPHEVAAVIRLALIGGGEAPKDASEIAQYYCSPPRPMKHVYLLAYECLHAVWNGIEPSTKAEKVSVAQMDAYFTETEADFIKKGADPSVIKGKSFAEVQALLRSIQGDVVTSAPDSETFNAIKAMSGKKAKKK